ncbi:MAG: DUF2339 domain-containing protein [Lentisphaerae bacterium]|nr:DUF2339 domain-containing protein [Lentisphaerota bacterium]
MEALLVVLSIFILLAFPIWVLILLHVIKNRQDRLGSLFNRLESRLDRLADTGPKAPPPVEPKPAPAPAPVPPPPVSRPPAPAPTPALAASPPPPPPRPTPAPPPALARTQKTAAAPARAPSPLRQKTAHALRRIWNWIIINEEFQPEGVSWEFAVATTWLLRLGIIIIVFGIAFFLKDAMDKGLIGPHARVLLATFTGLIMLGVGTRLLGKAYHLLGQGLLGGGFAVLYFSAFAAHSFYQLVGALPAFGFMALITLCAGIFATRFNSLLVAVLGILGGYGTPILLSTGAKNFPGLFGYLLLLGLGVLGISRRRQWPLLNHLAMLLTYGLAYLAIDEFYAAADFAVVMPFLAAFFLLFTVALFLYNIVRGVKATLLEVLGTLVNSAAFFILGRGVIATAFSSRAVAVLALALGAFYVVLVYRFLAARRQDRGLLLAFIALAAFYLVMVPPLAITREWITLSWSLQGLVMLWLAGKLDSRFLRGLALGAYALALLRLVFNDLARQYAHALPADLAWTAYLLILGNHLLAIGGPIAALGGAWLLLRRPPAATPGLQVTNDNDIGELPGLGPVATVTTAVVAILLLFGSLHLEIHRACSHFYAPLTYPAMSILWLALGVFLLTVFRRKGSEILITLLAVFGGLFVAKLLLFDAPVWTPDLEHLLYTPVWTPALAGLRALDFALCIGLLALFFTRLRGEKNTRRVAIPAGITALVLLFLFLTFELNTALDHFLPGMRAGGLTLLWALYALALLLGGLRRGVRGLRYASLALFLVVVAKVFLSDLEGLESIYRITAFIVLGILLFLAAFLYLRHRARFQHIPDKE